MAPHQSQGRRHAVPCRFAGALLCVCVCVPVPGWINGRGPARDAFTPAAGPQEFISQDWIRPGLAKVQGVREWQTNKRDRTCEAEAEGDGVSALQGFAAYYSASTARPPTQYAHKSTHTHRSPWVQVVQSACPIR